MAAMIIQSYKSSGIKIFHRLQYLNTNVIIKLLKSHFEIMSFLFRYKLKDVLSKEVNVVSISFFGVMSGQSTQYSLTLTSQRDLT